MLFRSISSRSCLSLGSALLLALGLSACGGSSDNSASNIASIKKAWTNFFSGKTSVASKVKYLQNGSQFTKVINEAMGLSVAKTLDVSISKVDVTSSSTANVVYSLSLSGQTALKDQTGTAIKVAGKWLVADSSFCSLVSLEGQSIPACSGSSTSTTS